jgi:hypothetical protein
MSTESTKKNEKNDTNYFCIFCDFNTSKITDYNRHIETKKHIGNKMATSGNKNNEKILYNCENCNKKYNDRTGLWKHKKKCKTKYETESASQDDSNQSATSDARDAGAALAESLIEDAKDADQEQIVRGLSMVANIDRIADSLDESSPALKDVSTPDEPANAKVLKISPIEQMKRIFRKVLGKYF